MTKGRIKMAEVGRGSWFRFHAFKVVLEIYGLAGYGLKVV